MTIRAEWPITAEVDRFRDASALVELLGDWTASRGALYRKLAAALERAIHAGDLHPGERLPSERRLAEALALSRATVVTAYDELRSRGLTDSRRGSGTRIRHGPRDARRVDGRVAGGRATSIFQRLVSGPGDVISLAYAVDGVAPQLRGALVEMIDEDLPLLFADAGYHPRGLLMLREAIASHYDEVGLPTTPDQVVVTTGASQALSLAAQLYLDRGSLVLVESPSWPGSFDIFRAAGAQLTGVALDGDGIRADALAEALHTHRPALLYVMPTYHNPTGTLMAAVRRQQVASLAAEAGVPVLEDNAYTTHSRTVAEAGSPPPIAAYAGRAEILSVGSLAKRVWAGLRIGWIRAPLGISDRLARLKALADLGSPLLDQALAARLFPRLPEIAAGRAAVRQERLDHCTRLIKRHLPAWRWRPPDGGSALWIELPATDARAYAQVALRHGVEVVPGAATDPSGAHDSYIRVPFTFPTEVLDELVERLGAAWLELERHGPPAQRSATEHVV